MKFSHLVFLVMIATAASVSAGSIGTVSFDTPDAVFEDWQFQADGKPTFELAQKEIGWARQIAARIGDGADLKAELSKLDELEKQLLERSETKESVAVNFIYFAIRQVKRTIMFKDPLIDFDEILLIDNPYPAFGREPAHEARHRNGFMAMMGGRLAVLEGLNPDANVRTLAPSGEKEASFWRPDISWDGKKVLYSMRPEGEMSFHIYECNNDGSGVKQLTFGD
ncbi:MAG: hypothetical protein K9M75_11865, partial [Phycisphaerae bacterium]|nr:hypothetical protein [Phycisphaerae bacterium]